VAWTVFASLAKKNLDESPIFDCPVPFKCAVSDVGGLKETTGRFGMSLSVPPMANPDKCSGGS
jgi:hypothetical protein